MESKGYEGWWEFFEKKFIFEGKSNFGIFEKAATLSDQFENG